MVRVRELGLRGVDLKIVGDQDGCSIVCKGSVEVCYILSGLN